MIPPWLTLSNIRYVSRVKWSNSGKGVAPSPTSPYCSYWKGSLLVALDYCRQLYFYLQIWKYITNILQLHKSYLTKTTKYLANIGTYWKYNENNGEPNHYKFFIIIIIIIMSHCQYRSPWPSLTTGLSRPSLPVGLQGCILYRHRAVVYRF